MRRGRHSKCFSEDTAKIPNSSKSHQVIGDVGGLVVIQVELERDCRVFGGFELTLDDLGVLLQVVEHEARHRLLRHRLLALRLRPVFLLLVAVLPALYVTAISRYVARCVFVVCASSMSKPSFTEGGLIASWYIQKVLLKTPPTASPSPHLSLDTC